MRRWGQLRAFVYVASIMTTRQEMSTDSSFDELLKKVPASPNVIVVLNAEKIFGSEVAMEGGWKQQYGATYADSPLLMPPSAQQFVLAATWTWPGYIHTGKRPLCAWASIRRRSSSRVTSAAKPASWRAWKSSRPQKAA